MKAIEEVKQLTDKDVFLVCVSVRRGENIETKCLTNNFTYSDIPVASRDIAANIDKLFKQAAPSIPSVLRAMDKNADTGFTPDEDDSDGEE